VVTDNLASGSLENVNSSALFYKVNVCDSQLASIFERERPDIVNHQAAQTAVARSMTDPICDAKENVLGSLNVIINCVRFRVKKIIYASSGGAVYGEPKYLPVDEKHPVNPISHYGVSKHTVEHYLYSHSLQHGLNYVVLRYSNVYGPRQSAFGESGVVAVFARQMLQGEQPTIFGPGNKTRDYVYVSDVVAANLSCMDRGNKTVFNICTGVETSDQKMFDSLAKLLSYSGNPSYAPVRTGEIYRIYLDAKKAKTQLGWQPQFSIEKGLPETVKYYKACFLRSKV